MNLTLAIPARDDAAGLERLLTRAAGLGCVSHLVVVDDGSAEPLQAGPLAAAAGLAPGRVTLLRNAAPRGPGAARNQALAAVETEHLLFLDADDLPARELAPLLADLEGQAFDFCLFQHHDSRAGTERRWGQMPWDQRFWRAAGVETGALSPVSTPAAAQLVQTANYPWNKIYRTGFLRDHGIGCSEIAQHEDVELHWRSFLRARSILASDRVCAVHFVAPGGGRLTNHTGPARLEVFAPLARLAAEIAQVGDSPFALPFYRFALGLCAWIEGNLRPEFHDALRARAADFAAGMPAPVRHALGASDPGLLERFAP